MENVHNTNVHDVVTHAINNLTKVEFKKEERVTTIQYKDKLGNCNSVTLYGYGYDFGVVSHEKWEDDELYTEGFNISIEDHKAFYQVIVNSLL